MTSLFCNLNFSTLNLKNNKIQFESNAHHIKSLWSWIKDLVKKSKLYEESKKNEKEKNISIIKTVKSDRYRDFCRELMGNLEIKHFDDFKTFLFAVLKRQSKKAKIDKLEKTKRLLSYSPNKYKN